MYGIRTWLYMFRSSYSCKACSRTTRCDSDGREMMMMMMLMTIQVLVRVTRNKVTWSLNKREKQTTEHLVLSTKHCNHGTLLGIFAGYYTSYMRLEKS